MIAATLSEPTIKQMEELRECVEKLRSELTKPEEIVKAFVTLLLMPTILGDNVKLEAIGLSRVELQQLSKRHGELFQRALHTFISDMVKPLRH